VRNVAFAVLGAAALVLKPSYHGPLEQVVFAYGGNVAVSLALYFAALSGAMRHGLGRTAAALGTLLAVEAFEVTNGFGVMANTYDPMDLAANAVGVGLALALDVATSRLLPKAKSGTVSD
ncbi:MAG: hypothetical protein PVF27_09685, partial [Gemmatimonadales bacterium]